MIKELLRTALSIETQSKIRAVNVSNEIKRRNFIANTAHNSGYSTQAQDMKYILLKYGVHIDMDILKKELQDSDIVIKKTGYVKIDKIPYFRIEWSDN